MAMPFKSMAPLCTMGEGHGLPWRDHDSPFQRHGVWVPCHGRLDRVLTPAYLGIVVCSIVTNIHDRAINAHPRVMTMSLYCHGDDNGVIERRGILF